MRVPGTASPFAFRCPVTAHQSETPLVGPALLGGSCVSRHANVCSESPSLSSLGETGSSAAMTEFEGEMGTHEDDRIDSP